LGNAVPNYWRDPKNGVGYQVQIEIPTHEIESSSAIAMVPVQERAGAPLLVRDVARVVESTMPGEYDRYNMRRVVSMTANLNGVDLGHAAQQVSADIKRPSLPRSGSPESGRRCSDVG
jgi:multidrug efflux pump subunit AcrB